MKVTSLIMIKPYWKRESKSLLEKRKKKKKRNKKKWKSYKIVDCWQYIKKRNRPYF